MVQRNNVTHDSERQHGIAPGNDYVLTPSTAGIQFVTRSTVTQHEALVIVI